MASSKTQFISSKELRTNSIKRKIKTFIYEKYQGVISSVKKAIGISLEKINYKAWEKQFRATVIDLSFTALVVAFILMAFTNGLSVLDLLAKGLAITLTMFLVLSFSKRFKEAIS